MKIELTINVWFDHNYANIVGQCSLSHSCWGYGGMPIDELRLDSIVNSALNVTVNGIPLYPPIFEFE